MEIHDSTHPDERWTVASSVFPEYLHEMLTVLITHESKRVELWFDGHTERFGVWYFTQNPPTLEFVKTKITLFLGKIFHIKQGNTKKPKKNEE